MPTVGAHIFHILRTNRQSKIYFTDTIGSRFKSWHAHSNGANRFSIGGPYEGWTSI